MEMEQRMSTLRDWHGDIAVPAPRYNGNGMTVRRAEPIAIEPAKPSAAAEAIGAAIGTLTLHPEDVAHIALKLAGSLTNLHLHFNLRVQDELDVLANFITDELRERAGMAS
jgi:hypothetical protein